MIAQSKAELCQMPSDLSDSGADNGQQCSCNVAQALSFRAPFSHYLNFSTDVWECGMHLQASLLPYSFLDIPPLETA